MIRSLLVLRNPEPPVKANGALGAQQPVLLACPRLRGCQRGSGILLGDPDRVVAGPLVAVAWRKAGRYVFWDGSDPASFSFLPHTVLNMKRSIRRGSVTLLKAEELARRMAEAEVLIQEEKAWQVRQTTRLRAVFGWGGCLCML